MQWSWSIRRWTEVQQVKSGSLVVVALLTILFLDACAVQQPFRFRPTSVTRVTYDPTRCIEMPGGKFKCKDVVFTVAAVEPAK
jgi:hypothetical protein